MFEIILVIKASNLKLSFPLVYLLHIQVYKPDILAIFFSLSFFFFSIQDRHYSPKFNNKIHTFIFIYSLLKNQDKLDHYNLKYHNKSGIIIFSKSDFKCMLKKIVYYSQKCIVCNFFCHFMPNKKYINEV